VSGCSGGAAVLLGTFLALNRGFVHQWVGGEFFGAALRTALLAAALLLSRRNGTALYLYGATGAGGVGFTDKPAARYHFAWCRNNDREPSSRLPRRDLQRLIREF
jgi:hypothetical protein